MPRSFLDRLTGSFAMPAGENPTVAMVEAAYRHHGLPWRYVNCEVAPADLGAAVRGARAMNWAGFNCSLPHKVAVIDHLDALGESASIMGAVNCVVRRGEALVGENTDGKGFLESLATVTNPQGRRVVLFGAGGAARAIGVELALAGAAEILVVNRDPARGEALARLVAEAAATHGAYRPWSGEFRVPEGTDVVVNATSIGLFPDVTARPPIAFDTLAPGMVVADVIPNPPRTVLLREAASRGCTTLDGLGMLVNQGLLGIRFWTGIDVDPTIMRRTLETIFDGR